MKIVKLSIKNLMKISAVEITPDGSVIYITGKNAAGKTSVLDSLAFLLGGTWLIPDKPIKEGETEAEVSADLKGDLEDLTATRKWKLNKEGKLTTTLKVATKDGAAYGSPQAVLDKLVGELTFDPLEFTRMSPTKQRDVLLGLVDLGINLDELAEKRNGFYEERTLVSREIKNKTGQLAGMDAPSPDIPKEEVSVAQLAQEYQQATMVKVSNNKQRQYLKEITGDRNDTTQNIERLKKELEQAEIALKEEDKLIGDLGVKISKLQDPDLESIQAKIDSAEETNQKVRAAKAYHKVKAEIEGLQKRRNGWEQHMEAIDQQKEDALSAAKFPVPGLSIGEDGITYNGIPFDQASSAEQLRVSVAMAMELNPKLRVIRITDGSLLDSENMAVIEKMAGGKDFQFWIEKVDESGEIGIVIEDGKVAN